MFIILVGSALLSIKYSELVIFQNGVEVYRISHILNISCLCIFYLLTFLDLEEEEEFYDAVENVYEMDGEEFNEDRGLPEGEEETRKRLKELSGKLTRLNRKKALLRSKKVTL